MRVRNLTFATTAALWLVTAIAAVAQESPAGAVTYVVAGALLDVESGKTLKNQAIIIVGERITEVGPVSELTRPSGSTLIDLTEYTVLPGLIDAHTHLNSNHNMHGYRRLTVSAPRTAIYGVVAAEATLMAGFTTVRNVGAAYYADIALRDAIQAGEIIGPRMKVSGPPLGMTGGHCDSNLLPPRSPEQLIERHDISDLEWSSSGQRLAMVVTELVSEDGQTKNIWMYEPEVEEFRKLTTGGESNHRPRWSPNGNTLAFLSSGRDDKTQIYVMPMNGGEAHKIQERNHRIDLMTRMVDWIETYTQ